MKGWKIMVLAGMCAMLSACSLIPQEEVLPRMPVIQEYKTEEFRMVQVVRGDMVLEVSVSCSYVPVQSETLSYAVGGEYFGETFVQAGQQVTKGQLLAQLDISDALNRLESCRIAQEQLEVRMAALEENRALALERERILSRQRSAAQNNEAIAAVNSTYDRQKQALGDEMQLLVMQREALEKEIAARRLYADIDGTVVYVRRTPAGAKSSEGEKMIVISDTQTSIFCAQTKYWDRFAEGSEYIITADGREYAAVVTGEEALGLPVVEKQEGKAEAVYFRLKDAAFELKEGQSGMLTLRLDSREGVLTLPQSAVSRINGQSVVYCPDEEGMKTYKAVETGLSAEGRIEILSGVAEGESVIAE